MAVLRLDALHGGQPGSSPIRRRCWAFALTSFARCPLCTGSAHRPCHRPCHSSSPTVPPLAHFNYPTNAGKVPLRWNFVVGEAGFEPATSCSQSRSATRLRYSPDGTASVCRRPMVGAGLDTPILGGRRDAAPSTCLASTARTSPSGSTVSRVQGSSRGGASRSAARSGAPRLRRPSRGDHPARHGRPGRPPPHRRQARERQGDRRLGRRRCHPVSGGDTRAPLAVGFGLGVLYGLRRSEVPPWSAASQTVVDERPSSVTTASVRASCAQGRRRALVRIGGEAPGRALGGPGFLRSTLAVAPTLRDELFVRWFTVRIHGVHTNGGVAGELRTTGRAGAPHRPYRMGP